MVEVVWFKRDLRVVDHPAWVAAVGTGNAVLPLFVYEPGLMAEPDYSYRHFLFQSECLRELAEEIGGMGGGLCRVSGSVVEVLAAVFDAFPEARLWSHEETGNDFTYRRDIAVAGLCRERGVKWTELPQNGVIRRLGDRDGWSKRWAQRMSDEPLPAVKPKAFAKCLGLESWPTAKDFGLEPDGLAEHEDLETGRQAGGRSRALALLDSFLTERGQGYTKEMSSPVTAFTACSRLSPHLAFGSLSVREAYHAVQVRRAEIKEMKAVGHIYDTRWTSALSSFAGRLRWHCHFMQKLEDEPAIEWQNFARAYDGLRPETSELLELWKEGKTGYPMVDACMQAVRATGYLNFRMRAMVTSFASYHLWLHWREPGLHLARMFTDYEPGIHWSQHQMQSGTTGINSIRIYSPRKQVEDHDPTGSFLKRWLPELQDVPDKYLPEPHLMPELEQNLAGCIIGKDYPAPVVDHRTAYAAAQKAIREVRRRPEAKAEADAVIKKHGSRKSPRTRSWR